MSELPNEEQPERFTLDLPVGKTLREAVEARIAAGRARTADKAALVLVCSVAVSLLVVYLVGLVWPRDNAELAQVFDKWLTATGPLAGLAVGFYFGEKSRS
jgi:hypothetical protein